MKVWRNLMLIQINIGQKKVIEGAILLF